MRKLLLAAVCIVCLAGSSHAACTEDEMANKAVEFVEKLQVLYEKDAGKAEEVAASLMNEADTARLEQWAKEKNYDAICKQYDEWISKLK